MTDLSPQAQAVLTAQAKERCLFEWSAVNDPPCHPSDAGWNGCVQCIDRRGTAAAIRAATDQVVPNEPEPEQSAMPFSDWNLKIESWDAHMAIRRRFLAIAAELEGGAALAQPEPQGLEPTDDELQKAADALRDKDDTLSLVEYARTVLARYGRPAIEPVPVSERLPKPEECGHPEGECWWFDPASDGAWYIDTYQGNYTHWLPHWALPAPQQEAGK